MRVNVRAEQNAVMLFCRSTGRTAYIDGEELEALIRWMDGEETKFSRRLKRLGILEEEGKEQIHSQILLAREKVAPLHSFCAPESLHIELTEQCKLNCPQCYKSLSNKELPKEILEDILHQAAEVRVFQIAFGGGEPLLYSHLSQAVAKTTEYGMSCSITTSGYGLSSQRLSELETLGLNHIQISLGGSTEEIHNHSRDGFSYGIQALQKLQKYTKEKQSTLSYGINWVARMDTIDDFPSVLHLAKTLQAQNINILRYKPSKKEEYSNIRLSKEKLLQLETMIRKAKGIPIKVDSAFSCLLCHFNHRAGKFTGCGAGRRFLAVDVEGFLKPCSHVSFREESRNLEETWFHSKVLENFRQINSSIGFPCNQCSYRNGCGSCRAIVMAQSNNFYAGDTECPFINPIS